MRIKCIENRVNSLPKYVYDNYSISYTNFSILIDKEYVVYGMTLHLGYIWYYIADEDYSYYPIWNPSPFFQILDGRLSRFWVYSYMKEENADQSVMIAFSKWANDSDFYEKLTDGDKKEIEIFKAYKELLDLEFPDFSITKIAQIGDAEWLICSTCIDAWENSNDRNAMVRCPKCQKVMHNPRYQGERTDI